MAHQRHLVIANLGDLPIRRVSRLISFLARFGTGNHLNSEFRQEFEKIDRKKKIRWPLTLLKKNFKSNLSLLIFFFNWTSLAVG